MIASAGLRAISGDAETVRAGSGHSLDNASFDNSSARRASEKDRRETKETGNEHENGLTRFTALD
jgi:hypothetical protein